ncbi:MAG: DNA alkylation repair protein [Bacteroidales bacterium]|nr:DNA alkylation repair protein [Bacteroidales bacterium]
MTHSYMKNLEDQLRMQGNSDIALGAKAYLRNQFEFFGVKAPERRNILAEFIKSYGLPKQTDFVPVMKSAWEHPCREMQYAAMELSFKMKKHFTIDSNDLLEFLICNKSWWDTVDYISPNLVSNYFILFPEKKDETLERWMISGNIWLQRSCLLFQLKAKEKTDVALLYSLIRRLSTHPDFFIRKAIGWALREHAKRNPESVKLFVDSIELSGLSKREALKHIG